jgi:hypothetical protein
MPTSKQLEYIEEAATLVPLSRAEQERFLDFLRTIAENEKLPRSERVSHRFRAEALAKLLGLSPSRPRRP